MTLHLLLVASAFLFQDSPAQFARDMERLYASGTDAKQIIGAIDAYCEGKSAGVRARLGWNRALIEARDRLRVEYIAVMKPKIGQRVDVGDKVKQSGKLLELREAGLILEVTGGQIEISYASLGLPHLLKVARPEGGASEEECLNRAAGGSIPSAAEIMMKIREPEAQLRAASALAGLALQNLDVAIAEKKFDRALADLSATWLKHPVMLKAAGGALAEFMENELPAILLAHGDEAAKQKDRKPARKLLEQALAMARPAELRSKIIASLWGVLASGDWLELRLDDTIQVSQATLENGRVICEDDAGPGSQPALFTSFPVPMAELSGVKARVLVGTTKSTEIRWITDMRKQIGDGVGVNSSPPSATHCSFSEGPTSPKANKRLAQKAEYELLIEVSGGKVRSAVDGVEIYSGPADRKPCEAVWFVVNDGKGEMIALQVRKK